MSHIRLVQIMSEIKFEGNFTNLQTSADDVEICGKEPTNTPGQFGDGCNIPDCRAGKWWDTHRMTITLDKSILSLWKEDHTVYYRMNQTVYPGEGRGDFLWEDNGLPVVLSIAADSTVTMTNP